MKKIAIIIALLILLGFSIWFNIKNLDRNKIARIIATENVELLEHCGASETIGRKLPVVTISTLCDAFNMNKSLAEKNYISRYIILDAVVSENSVRLGSGTTILGKNQNSLSFSSQSKARKSGWLDYKSILCTMLADQDEHIKFLQVGDKVRIRGLVNGTIGQTIIMDGCEILN